MDFENPYLSMSKEYMEGSSLLLLISLTHIIPLTSLPDFTPKTSLSSVVTSHTRLHRSVVVP